MKKVFFVLAFGQVMTLSAQNTFPTAANTNVGIGTTAPSARLHIMQAATGSNPGSLIYPTIPDIRVGRTSPFGANDWWNIRSVNASTLSFEYGSGTAAPQTVFALSSAGIATYSPLTVRGGSFNILNTTNTASALQLSAGTLTVNQGNALAISPNNKMAIGITDAAKRAQIAAITNSEFSLYVANGIRTEKVKVDLQSTWADYVFDENYKLLPLDSLENYINTEKHLPKVPTAAELEKEGVDVSEMLKIQMEKTEELTLYLLQQKEQIEQQKKQIEQLQMLVNQLLSSSKSE